MQLVRSSQDRYRHPGRSINRKIISTPRYAMGAICTQAPSCQAAIFRSVKELPTRRRSYPLGECKRRHQLGRQAEPRLSQKSHSSEPQHQGGADFHSPSHAFAPVEAKYKKGLVWTRFALMRSGNSYYPGSISRGRQCRITSPKISLYAFTGVALRGLIRIFSARNFVLVSEETQKPCVSHLTLRQHHHHAPGQARAVSHRIPFRHLRQTSDESRDGPKPRKADIPAGDPSAHARSPP